MKATVGQRYLFLNEDWHYTRSFVCEVTKVGGLHYKVVQLINEKQYTLGQEVFYGGAEFDPAYFFYLEGQDAPK